MNGYASEATMIIGCKNKDNNFLVSQCYENNTFLVRSVEFLRAHETRYQLLFLEPILFWARTQHNKCFKHN